MIDQFCRGRKYSQRGENGKERSITYRENIRINRWDLFQVSNQIPQVLIADSWSRYKDRHTRQNRCDE